MAPSFIALSTSAGPAREHRKPRCCSLGGRVEQSGHRHSSHCLRLLGPASEHRKPRSCSRGSRVERGGTVSHRFVYIRAGLQESKASLDAGLLGCCIDRRGANAHRLGCICSGLRESVRASTRAPGRQRRAGWHQSRVRGVCSRPLALAPIETPGARFGAQPPVCFKARGNATVVT